MTTAAEGIDQLCVHCGRRVADTQDHWFPASWWPAGVLPNVQRFTFPSCRDCNGRLGEIEDRLRSRLALGLSPSAPGAQGLVQSVHRSMNPERGKSHRDRSARRERREKLFRQTFPLDLMPTNSILPGLGPVPDVPLSEQLASGVAPADLEAFVEKLVRGLTYIQLQRLVPESHKIRMHLFQPEGAVPFTDHLDRAGTTLNFGPAIRARVARAPENALAAVYEFIIWERLTVYALCVPPEGGE